MEFVDVLLINPPFHTRQGSSNIFPLGLGYIMSSIKSSGFSYGIVDCTQIISTYFEEDLSKLKIALELELERYKPLIVGIGPCITTQVKSLKIIADCCIKKYDKNRIYAGGPLASITGQEWFFYDYLGIENIMKGDGEKAIVDAIKFVKAGNKLSECPIITNRNNVYFNIISEIDSIEFPIRENITKSKISMRRRSDDENKITAHMITSRGCPYKCSYCVSGNLNHKKFRKRSNENIIDEIIMLYHKHQVNDIIFYDDCFFYDIKHANEEIEKFCKLLESTKTNITWQIEIRADFVMQISVKSIKTLQNAGCRQINIGIEKTDVSGLDFLKKNVPLKQLPAKINEIKKNSNIKVAGTFILGGIKETENDILNIINNSKKMNLDYAHYSPLFLYPGTPLYNEFFDNEQEWVNYILSDSLPWGEIVYENKYVSKEKLIELTEFAYSEFYEDTPYASTMMVKDRFNLREGK